MKPNLILDTKGMFCPLPIIKTSEAAKNLQAGSLLEVISDDPAIAYDMPAWCKSSGHQIQLSRKQGEVYTFLILIK
jgi:tRNA 2-thiouridine synthesizing protein A